MAQSAAMSPPITPAPTTCTCRALKSTPLARPFILSCRKKMRIRLRVVGCSNSALIEQVGIVRSEERIAVVLLPGVEDRVGRRVVLAPRLFRDLLAAPGVRRRTCNGPSNSLCTNPKPLRRGRLQRHHARGVLQDAQRHRLVDEAHALGAPGVDRLAGEQHVQRGGRADQLRQPLQAVPERPDAEHHLRKGEARLRIVQRDAVAAGERRAPGRRPCRSR